MQLLLSEGEGNTPSMTKIRKLKGKISEEKNVLKRIEQRLITVGTRCNDLQTRVSITARSCAITSSHISLSPDPTHAEIQAAELHASLEGKRIHEIADWGELLKKSSGEAFGKDDRNIVGELGRWLNVIFGRS
jgi:hypothetical protein